MAPTIALNLEPPSIAVEIGRPLFEFDELPDFLPKELREPLEKHDDVQMHDDIQNQGDTQTLADVDGDGTTDAVGDDESEFQDSGDAESDGDWEPNVHRSRRIKREKSLSITRSAPAKVRMSGGVPPIRKKVFAEGDSDDEIIWDMKRKGYRDQPICDFLISAGRTKYDVKTIATRFARIKKAKTTAEEQRLESDFEDYHEKDDEVLQAALDEVSHKYAKELSDAEDRHWANVVEIMNSKLPAPKFTRKLAKERWEALETGTGVVPLEQDPDPEARSARIKKAKMDRLQSKNEALSIIRRDHMAKIVAHEKALRAKVDAQTTKKRKREVRQADAEEKRRNVQEAALAAAALRRDEVQKKADGKVQQILERQRRKQDNSNKKAAAAWQRKVQMADLRYKKQHDKLRLAQEAADKKAAAIKAELENTNRKEIIRRHMRLAGAAIAAPLAEAPHAAAAASILKIAEFANSTKDMKELASLDFGDNFDSECSVNNGKLGFGLKARPTTLDDALGQSDTESTATCTPKVTRSKSKLAEAASEAESTPLSPLARFQSESEQTTTTFGTGNSKDTVEMQGNESNAKAMLTTSAFRVAVKQEKD